MPPSPSVSGSLTISRVVVEYFWTVAFVLVLGPAVSVNQSPSTENFKTLTSPPSPWVVAADSRQRPRPQTSYNPSSTPTVSPRPATRPGVRARSPLQKAPRTNRCVDLCKGATGVDPTHVSPSRPITFRYSRLFPPPTCSCPSPPPFHRTLGLAPVSTRKINCKFLCLLRHSFLLIFLGIRYPPLRSLHHVGPTLMLSPAHPFPRPPTTSWQCRDPVCRRALHVAWGICTCVSFPPFPNLQNGT